MHLRICGGTRKQHARHVPSTRPSFDARGNRTKVTDSLNSAPRTTVNYTRNGLNQYTAVGGAHIGYGYNGNLSTYDGWTYSYNALSQLTSAVNGSTTAYFWYDGLGRICTRQINGGTGVRFNVFDGWNLVVGSLIKSFY